MVHKSRITKIVKKFIRSGLVKPPSKSAPAPRVAPNKKKKGKRKTRV